jgi:hypothetical protein
MKGEVVVKDGLIEFTNVPIITPNGDILVRSSDNVISIYLFFTLQISRLRSLALRYLLE